jgi:hypothetical protein
LGTQAKPATVLQLKSFLRVLNSQWPSTFTTATLVHLLQCPSTFTTAMDVSSNFSKENAQVHLLYKAAIESTFETVCLPNTSNTLATHSQHICNTFAK